MLYTLCVIVHLCVISNELLNSYKFQLQVLPNILLFTVFLIYVYEYFEVKNF